VGRHLSFPQADFPRPDKNQANTSRWLAENLYYGFLSTISTRSTGSSVGAPFGNPYSYSLVDGVPYFYLFMGDVSAEDALQPAPDSNPLSTFSLSASSFSNVDDSKEIDEIAYSQCNIQGGGDPESPLCARLVFTGNLVNATEAESGPATDALFKRHPSMKWWPNHGWFVAKFDIQTIFFLDFYGPSTTITREEYLNAAPNPGPYSDYKEQIAAQDAYAGIDENLGLKVEAEVWKKGEESAALVQSDLSMCSLLPSSWKPPFFCKPETARWMTKTMPWGALTTLMQTDHGGSTVTGAPFGNIQSFAEVDGTPYFYIMMEDPVGENAFGVNADPRAALTLTEAQLGNVVTGSSQLPFMCKIGIIGDPENPPCARLVLSGSLHNVTDAGELAAAKEALFTRHPQFTTFPDSHGFFVVKLDITSIWMIAIYGPASIVSPQDYFAVRR
jgi:hypothetical protein